MNLIKLKFILPCILVSLLVIFGGKIVNSVKGINHADAEHIAAVNHIAEQIVGYWTSTDSANPEYEFFESADVDVLPSEMHGRIFEGGKLVNMFYWQLQDNGTILLNLVDGLCAERPFAKCPSMGVIKMQAIGAPISNGTWNFRYEDSNGISNRNIESKYSRKAIDLSALSQGEFAFSKSEVFDYPLAGEVNGNNISLWVDWFRTDGQRQKLSANFDVGMKDDIKFDGGEDFAFYASTVFYVDGIGAKNLNVKTWYENVVLSASQGNTYSLRLELHKQIQFPSDIDPARVHLDGFKLLTKYQGSYAYINRFIHGPTIKSMDKFFSFVSADLGNVNRTFGGWAGELVFTSNDDVTLGLIDNIKGSNTNSANRSYKWSQSDDGTIFLKSLDSKVTTIRFIKVVSGGYNVLYHYADGRYSRHDLILDAASVVNESTFAGRYQFISNSGFSVIEINFHKNKTVTSVPNIVNGHWFQDTNGDIVSFECTTLARQDINNYAECYADFEHLSDMAFVHIRRLGFLNKDGNKYQLRYSASFYGDVFNTRSVSDDYLSLNWTYRWLRVSEE